MGGGGKGVGGRGRGGTKRWGVRGERRGMRTKRRGRFEREMDYMRRRENGRVWRWMRQGL